MPAPKAKPEPPRGDPWVAVLVKNIAWAAVIAILALVVSRLLGAF